MILVIGGYASGKREFASSLGFDAAQMSEDPAAGTPVLLNAHELLRDRAGVDASAGEGAAADASAYAAADADPAALAARLAVHAVVTCAEVGAGIVPIDPCERAFRENAGRLAVALADSAACVVRMSCGIPQVLKGALPCAGRSDARLCPSSATVRFVSASFEGGARGTCPAFLSIYRHGPTRANRARKYLGRLDEPLDWVGEEAIRAEGANARVACVYVSPLSRCRQTAAILFPNAEQVVVEDLQEMDFGEFDGFSYEELSNDPRYQTWVDEGCKTACPGGEDQARFAARVVGGIRTVIDDARARGLAEAVVVAHAGTAMAAFWSLCESERDYFDWHIKAGKGLRARVLPAADGVIRLACPEEVVPAESL